MQAKANVWMKSTLRTFVLFLLGAGLVLALYRGAEASPLLLSPAGVDARHPEIVVSAGQSVHVVWEQDGGIWHRMRRQGVWTAPTRIVASGEHPTLAAAPSGDIVYLAWSQVFGDNLEIFASRWDGSSWSVGQNVSSNDGGSATPALAVAPTGDVHLLWSDTSSGSPILYHAVSPDGLAWPDVTPLPDLRGSNPTAVFGPDGALHVAWQYRPSFSEKNRIWTSSLQGTWRTPVALTDGSTHALAPRLAANATQMALTWQEGSKVRLAEWRNNAWQSWLIDKGLGADVGLTQNGTLLWTWTSSQGVHYRFWHGAWSSTYDWGQSAQSRADARLATAGNQTYAVWTENDGQNWQVLFDELSPANLYMPIVLR